MASCNDIKICHSLELFCRLWLMMVLRMFSESGWIDTNSVFCIITAILRRNTNWGNTTCSINVSSKEHKYTRLWFTVINVAMIYKVSIPRFIYKTALNKWINAGLFVKYFRSNMWILL